MAIKIIPDPIGRLGRGGLSLVGGGVQTYDQRVLALAPIAYWPLNEPVGTTGAGSVLDASGNDYHATPTAVTFGAPGVGDGETAADFDGATSIVVMPAGFRTAFDVSSGSVGSIFLWLRMAAPEWADGAYRYALNIGTNTGSNTVLSKTNAANTLLAYRNGGGVENYMFVSTAGATDFIFLAWTWSTVSDEIKVYFNGVQSGVTQGTLGTWTGATQDPYIGTNTANFHKGQIAHVAVFDKVLTADEILALSSP